MGDEKRDLKGIALIIVAIIALLAVSLFINEKVNDWDQQRMNERFNDGVKYGVDQAVNILFARAAACQQVPLQYNNQTLNLVAIECLQAAAQQQQG